MARRRGQKLYVGMVARLRSVTNIHIICGLQKGDYVRIAKIEGDEVYISFLNGKGKIPLGGVGIRPLSPLEQLAMAADG